MPPALTAYRLPVPRRMIASILTAFVVAAVTHLVTVFVFFVVNGSAAANAGPISDFFLPTTLVLLVLYFVASALGANRNALTAFAAGLVVGALATFLGTVYTLVQSGQPIDGQSVALILASLVGTSLVYFVVSAVVAATAGRWVWGASVRYRPGRLALIRQPSPRLAEGELTHLERGEIDLELADTQWDAYVKALTAAGFDTLEIPAADDHPDSVFIEDAVVVLGGTAVVTRPGAETRRGETAALAPIVKRAGLKRREIIEPGALDGGDVLEVGSTIYVGQGGRTNAEGIRQFRAIATKLGYTVIAVPVTKVLHLKSAVTALPDGTVVGFEADVDDPRLFDRFLALPERGAAVVVLSADAVLMAESVPESRAVVESLGYTVVAVDVTEFEKLEGCVTCLSVRLT